jgi:hypothetical protein
MPITIGAGAAAPSSSSPARASRLDIVALVFAVLLPPVGLILAHVANDELRQAGSPRRGLVTAAIVVGWTLTIALVIWIVAATLR